MPAPLIPAALHSLNFLEPEEHGEECGGRWTGGGGEEGVESQDTRVSTPGRGVSREVNDQESPHWASRTLILTLILSSLLTGDLLT